VQASNAAPWDSRNYNNSRYASSSIAAIEAWNVREYGINTCRGAYALFPTRLLTYEFS
jgi:hypothetical protein